MQNRKTKPENPGLGGRLNPGFRFKKVRLPECSGSGKHGLQTIHAYK